MDAIDVREVAQPEHIGRQRAGTYFAKLVQRSV
jgi:hypothetical protein